MSKIEPASSLAAYQRPARPSASAAIALSLAPDSLKLSRPIRDGARPRSSTPTAECNDGSYSYSEHASGTCSDHGGVEQWLGAAQPVPPPVDNPVPPPHQPRYFWMPTYPAIMPTEARPLPQIPMTPRPSGPAPVDPSSVSRDPFVLTAEAGRLRTQTTVDPVAILAAKGQLYGAPTGWWIFKTHHQLSGADAQQALSSGQTIYLNDGNGYQSITSANQLLPLVQQEAHPAVTADQGRQLLAKGQPLFLETDGSFSRINQASSLDPAANQIRASKLQDLQNQAQASFESQVRAADQQDVQNRLDALPAFNSIYNMEGLNMTNMMVTEDGREFNRNLITAMNVYSEPDTRQEIAEKWHENPNMSTSEFNQMANSVINEKVGQLFWNASWDGDSWGTYLGQQPVPGLRYPDTQQDVDWNTQTIQRVASELPMLLNANVLQ